MAKGNIAKDYVTAKIQEIFGDNFLGVYDKKVYVQAPENGEMIQVALALTCPKTPVEIKTGPVVKNGMIDFEAQDTVIAAPVAEITDDERATVAEMMKRFGL